MSETTVRQATLSRISSRASRFSSASRFTAARWWAPAPPHPVERARRAPRAEAREGRASRDRPAAHVRAIARQPQLLPPREVLRRERLFALEQLKVGELCFMPFQPPPDRGRRSDAH